MTTIPAPTVTEFARHAAGNLTTFSGAYSLTSARLQHTAAFLAAGTPLMLKGAILGDPSLTIQWMAVANGRTVVLTRPVVATDTTNTPIYLASLSDDLAQATPVALATSIATAMVVTLVRHADAVTLGLPGCAAVPGQLDPPPSGDGVVDQAGIDRLHFDASGGDSDAPVFAVLPLVYPLALGEVPFLQSITGPLDSPAALSCGARVWFDGLRYLATFNAGRSLHSHPLLFNAANLSAEHFPTSTLGDNAQVTITTVSALSAHYGHVTVLHRKTGNGAFLAHASLLPAPALVTPRPVSASVILGLGISNLEDFTSAISTAITTTLGSATPPFTTHVERELKQDQKDVMACYQITWGRVVTVLDPTDGSASEQIVLPEWTTQFKAVLTPTSKASNAEAAFHESFDNNLCSKRRSVLFLDGMASWDGRVWGIPGIQSLREFRWAKDPLLLIKKRLKSSSVSTILLLLILGVHRTSLTWRTVES
jgi:hypothetical protein